MAEQELSSLIDISTKPVRRYFRLDEEKVYLRSIQELSLAENHLMFVSSQATQKQVAEIDETTTAPQLKKISDDIKDILERMIAGDPPAAVKDLTDQQRLAIMTSFFTQGTSEPQPETSPVSSDSTEEASENGSA